MKTPRLIVCSVLLVAGSLAGCASPRIDPMSIDPAMFRRQLSAQFNYRPPQPAPAELPDAAAGQAADAQYLSDFADFDRAYTERTRSEARDALRRLRDDAASLTHEAFVLRIARITALADNGHTSVNDNAFRRNTPRVPLRMYGFADGVHVVRARSADADLLGARIDTIDGHPLDEVVGVLSGYVGGIESRRRGRVTPLLESPRFLRAAGIAGEPHALTIAGVRDDGTRFERRIEAEDRDRSAPVVDTPRLLFPAPPDNPERMQSVAKPGDPVPVYLREPNRLFATAPLDRGGLYIALGANVDSDEMRIADFLADAIARIARDKPSFVVIDFRMDGGGDYTKTYPFMGALLQVAGDRPVYALTSAWTFSAAIATVAALKTFGGDRVHIVGEPVGDRLDFWAEGGAFTLPNANIVVFYTSGRHVYNGRCSDPNCFWLNDLFPMHVATLDPEIPAPMTYAAWRAGHDPALDAVMAREAVRRPAGQPSAP